MNIQAKDENVGYEWINETNTYILKETDSFEHYENKHI